MRKYITREEERRAWFDRLHGDGALAKLHELLSSGCLTMGEIGGRFGITRERVRQIYLRDFGATGRSRQSSCTLKRIRFGDSGKKRFSDYVLLAWRRARRAGFKVEPVRESGRYATRTDELRINGRLCAVRVCRKARLTSKHQKTPVFHFWTRGGPPGAEFLILTVPTQRRVFVVPAASVGESVYVPADAQPFRMLNGRRWMPAFEDAWWLLNCETRKDAA